MTPRVLPHRPEAENAVLGGILLRGSEALAEALAEVSIEDFYQPRALAVFRAMVVLEGRGEPLDVITLEVQLRRTGELELVGGIEGLASFDRYATTHNIKAHAALVRESAQVRGVVIVGREIAEQGMEELDDAAAYVVEAEAKLFAVAGARRKGGPRHVRAAMAGVIEEITARQRDVGNVTGISTGYAAMDALTAGLQASDLIIIAGRPSMGKTAFALNIASNAAISTRPEVMRVKKVAEHQFGNDAQAAYRHLTTLEDKRERLHEPTPVCFFSMEMSEAQLIERVLCSEARVDAQTVRKGGRLMESQFRELIDAADRMANWSGLYIDDRPALTITEIKSVAMNWARKHCQPVNPDEPDGKQNGMIIVDYLQLARGSAGSGNREQEIGDISRGLKGLAKELKMPVVALAQLNRNVDARADHRPTIADLRESGAIEQDADVIMFIYREARYLTAESTEEQRAAVEGKAEIIIGKQRNGPTGTVNLTFIDSYTRFENQDYHGY